MTSTLAEAYVHTTEQPNLTARPAANDRGAWPRRPDASGENPIYVPSPFSLDVAPSAELTETQKLFLPVTYGKPAKEPEPVRPWFYRGFHRWTRSRALLTAATWPGGVR